MIFLFVVLILLISECQFKNIVKCYYEYDDSALEIDDNRPQSKNVDLKTNSFELNTKGFGFWSKYVHNRKCSLEYWTAIASFDSYCQSDNCQFKGITMMKLVDQEQNLFATLMLNMNDNPVSLTHDFYLFPIGSNLHQSASISFDPSQYQNIWIYTSIIYSTKDQTITLFTNVGEYIRSFNYQILTDSITIELGGTNYPQYYYEYNLISYPFNGYISPIQEYDSFSYYDEFFFNLFSLCPFQEQKTQTKIQNIQYFYSSYVLSYYAYYHQMVVNNRYILKLWIKQDYLEAYNYYKTNYQEDHQQLVQAPFRIDYPVCLGYEDRILSSQLAKLYYTVDFQNVNKTIIHFETQFYKIPIYTPMYTDDNLRQYDRLIISRDNLYEQTQKWHYFILEYGRTPTQNGETLQLRLYFYNEEPLIYNLGTQNYNSQFTGNTISIRFQILDYFSQISRVKFQNIKFISGFQGDNEDQQDCYKNCKNCNGPMNYDCTSCFEEYNFVLTQFNQCECKYMFVYNEKTDQCDKIEDSKGLIITQEAVQNICKFGYFQVFFENQYLCIQCPQYHIVNLFCGDCYFQPLFWYLKPVCTFDYIQIKSSDSYQKHSRLNSQRDVYYLDQELNLLLLDGASDYCVDSLDGCEVSQYHHLNEYTKIRCKNNHFYDNFICKMCDPYCVNCQSENVCLACIESRYFNKKSQKCELCSSECLSCTTDLNSEFGQRCLTCAQSYTLTYQGQCKMCGMNCQYCKEDYNQSNQQYFLRCLKCLNDKIMAIRFNGIDCLIIEQKNCQYVMIISRSQSLKYNSYSYNFEPSNDLSDELPVCALCEPTYTYYTFVESCLQSQLFNCLVGISHIYSGDDMISNYKNTCLIGEASSLAMSYQGQENCQAYFSNCNLCYVQYKYTPSYCLECFEGYFNHRLIGDCQKCPESLNCKTCFQQSIGYNDVWKQKIALFNQFLKVRLQPDFFFAQHDQSQNPSDYEIVCFSCFDGYVLIKGKCIKYCDSNCETCIFQDDQYICLTCGKNGYHNLLTIIQYQCAICPSFCELCRVRTDEEIFKLNSLFVKNSQNQIFTYQCLKPFLYGEKIFYDSIFGQFFPCVDDLQCENVLTIELNLFCSEQDYENKLSSITDKNLQSEFKMKNIAFQTLIQSNIEQNSFSYYETNAIYEILNKKSIKKIKIFLKSQQEQTCQINQFSYISQKFSKFVFNAIEIQLTFISEIKQPLIIQILREVNFVDFSFLRFENIQIEVQESIYPKILSAYGFKSIDLELEKIIISSKLQLEYTFFNFQCDQLNSLKFNHVQLKNTKFDNSNLKSIFAFQFTSKNDFIRIQDFSILNCILRNSNIIEINSLIHQSIDFKNFIIDSELFNSSLITSGMGVQLFTITNFFASGTLEQTKPFITLKNVVSTDINNFTIKQMNLIESTFLILEKQAKIYEFYIFECQIQGRSSFISNNFPKQSITDIHLSYQIDVLTIQNIKSSNQTQILNLQPFSSNQSKLELWNVKIYQNNINDEYYEAEYLFIIQLQIVNIVNCDIVRGNGLSEFYLDQQQLRFLNLKVNQFEISVLHQYFECSNMQKFKNQHPNFIKLVNIINVFFENLIIERVNILNAGLIQFLQQSKSLFSENIIIFQNVIFQNNLIITSNNDASASLISILSNQKIQITIFSSKMLRNQLHNYKQNLQIPSAVCLSINCPSGYINLFNSQFYNNFATNTPDSIINIIANQIKFNGIEFVNNSIYNLSSLLSNLFLGFSSDQDVLLSNLKSIFQLQNFVGNAYLSADTISGSNTLIQNSEGKNGVGLYLKAKFIKLEQIQFINLTSFFKFNEENGACIYIEIPSSECQVLIQNIKAENVTTKDYGSVVYIQSEYDNLNLTLQNLTVSSGIAFKGSIIYGSFLNNTLFNHILINKLQIRNQKLAFQNYIKKTVDNKILLANFNDRVSIYLQNAIIFVSDITIMNLFGEAVLLSLDQGDAILSQIKILNGSGLNQQLIQMRPNNNQNTTIQINGIFIENISQFDEPLKQCQLFYTVIKMTKKNMQCQVNNQKLINEVISDKYEDNSEQIKCMYQSLLSQAQDNNQGIIKIVLNKDSDLIQISEIRLINNNYLDSLSGLIFIQLQKFGSEIFQIQLKQIIINHNECGKVGCIYINSKIFDENQIYPQNENRLLTQNYEKILQQLKHDIKIINYECLGNVANFGTCLFSNFSNIKLKQSIFFNNTAKNAGGTIYFIGKEYKLFLINCQIFFNQAKVAGAIYFDDSISQDINKSQTILQDNRAQQFGQNIFQAPVHLSLTLDNYQTILPTFKVQESVNFLKEQIGYSANKQNTIFLPSGSSIYLYKKYDPLLEILEEANLTFRIVALDNQFQQIKNLINTECQIQTQLYNLALHTSEQILNNASISQNSVPFNTTTMDYNFDSMVINFDSENTGKYILQLIITCDSIKIPQYDETNQIINKFHNNYQLIININTLKCRVGQIRSMNGKACFECDYLSDQYSITNDSNKCSIRDEQTTQSVTSFQLNLKQGFWRPYFDNNNIEECYNLQKNCLGGWQYGDNSCYLGHFGAMCELCDVENIRGDGHFSNAQSYSCGSCDDIKYNIAQIIGFSIWTLFTIILSVKGAITLNNSFLESPYLIKLLTNYLQIISSLTSFKLSLPVNFFYFLNGVGNPLQTVSYSLDCQLIQMTSLEIHYSRLIWQLLLPCIYFSILAIIYMILIFTKYIKHRAPIIMTALIYMYIYFQPNLMGSFISMVSTRTIANVPWIQAYVAYRFDTLLHRKWVLLFCIPFLSLFGVVIPFILLVCLIRNKDKLQHKRGKSLFGYLYYEYKLQAYFWEIIKIITKELLILFLVFYEDFIIIKGSFIFFLLLCYWSLNLQYSPFRTLRLNLLDYQSSIVCGVSMILGICLNVDQKSQVQNISPILFSALIIINIFMLVRMLYYIFNAYSIEMENSLDIIKSKILSSLPKSLKMNKQCQRFFKTKAETRQRVKANIQRLKSALQKHLSQSKNTRIIIVNPLTQLKSYSSTNKKT
ncbi:unnamed protein product [Paramecium sonneborni]|uniref:Transmembrane protein n=1 Tax=Paramecium sonneborni TaxID=65129 RepID=A0A8S1RTN9_9CILI|nr:unnamed protein product [Paramecium sonneborni]